MHEVEEWSEQRRVARDEKTEFDKRLQGAGEEMRDKALHRCSRGKEKSSSARQMGVEKQKRRAAIDPAFAEQRDPLVEHVRSKAEIENKRLKFDEDRLDFERCKGEEDAVRVRRAKEHETKVLALNEKRIELETERVSLDTEERMYALDEWMQIITVLGALAEKLK